MAEENQRDTNSAGETSDSLLSTCEDVQITIDGANLVISISGTDSFAAEGAVTGTNCQTSFECVWDGQKWVCS